MIISLNPTPRPTIDGMDEPQTHPQHRGLPPFFVPLFDTRTIHHAYGTMGTMQNPDPNSESMYQLPIHPHADHMADHKTTSGWTHPAYNGGRAEQGGKGKQKQAGSEIDLDDLDQRLAHLGLKRNSTIDPHQPIAPVDTHPAQAPQLASAFVSPQTRHYRLPSAAELQPQDSVSMYRLPQPQTPSATAVSGRRGGTDVDGADEEYGQHEAPRRRQEHDARTMRSYATRDAMTIQSPRTEVLQAVEKRTTALPSARTDGSVAGDMYAMRSRLLSEHAAEERHHAAELSRQLDNASQLATALSKLSSTEYQLRSVQATLIAERVARNQVQQEHDLRAEDTRDIKTELAGAVRALRRARDEGKKVEEERRRLARAFEEAKTQLYRYHEELKVRDARAMGREEGRLEAWQEAERWMGGSPPIPVDPVHTLPEAVLHQSPSRDQPPKLARLLSRQPRRQYHSPLQHQGYIHSQPHAPTEPHTPNLGPELPPHPSRTPYQATPQSRTMHAPQATQLPFSERGMSAPAPPPPSEGIRGAQSHLQPFAFPLPGHDNHMLRPSQPRTAQAARYIDFHDPPQQHRTAVKPMTAYTGSAFPAPSDFTRPAPGESYLRRIDHDSEIQHMLDGTLSRSFRDGTPSGAPGVVQQSRSTPATQGYRHDGMNDLVSKADKPLPDPLGSGPMPRSHSIHPHSQSGTLKPPSAGGPRRMSLSEGLHAHTHTQGQMGDGDRYPPFPHLSQAPSHLLAHGQRGHHSRQSSFGTIDPGAYALPSSTAVSPTSARHVRTPGHSLSGAGVQMLRSRVADALRSDGDIDVGLSGAKEADEGPTQDIPESRVMQNLPSDQRTYIHRKTPSMPTLRKQPIPIMPSRLSGTENPAFAVSNHRLASQSDFGVRPTAESRQAPAFSGVAKHLGAHSSYVPPDVGSTGIRGRPQDVAAPSALGLEGMDQGLRTPPQMADREGEEARTAKTGRTRAPTITVHPPSTRSATKPSSDSPYNNRAGRAAPHRPSPVPLQSSDNPRSPQYAAGPAEAYQIPLPPPRSHAPTVYSDFSPRSVRADRAAAHSPVGASSPSIPITSRGRVPPPLDSMAGTMDKMARVNVMDYAALAAGAPLPPSTTTGPATPETRTHAPPPGSSSPHVGPRTPKLARQRVNSGPVQQSAAWGSDTFAMGHNRHASMEPRMVPLPSSRGTLYHRPRASSYARTEGTIEEVTEEESGRENRNRRKR